MSIDLTLFRVEHQGKRGKDERHLPTLIEPGRSSSPSQAFNPPKIQCQKPHPMKDGLGRLPCSGSIRGPIGPSLSFFFSFFDIAGATL